MEYLADGLAAALHLLLHLDDATRAAIAATLLSTGYAMTAAMLLGLPAGFMLGYVSFPGRRALRLISDTLLAFPTVLIGLLVYAFITYRGPLGEWGLLFTLPGMAIGQAVLALPIVVSWTAQAVVQRKRSIGIMGCTVQSIWDCGVECRHTHHRGMAGCRPSCPAAIYVSVFNSNRCRIEKQGAPRRFLKNSPLG